MPAVVFLERSRQLAREGRMAPAKYLEFVRGSLWILEPFGAEEALRARAHAMDDRAWKRLARDAMVAGHVRAGDRLWTANPRDFVELGLSEAQVVDVHAPAP